MFVIKSPLSLLFRSKHNKMKCECAVNSGFSKTNVFAANEAIAWKQPSNDEILRITSARMIHDARCEMQKTASSSVDHIRFQHASATTFSASMFFAAI